MRSDKRSPLTSNLCPIINTLEHLVLVLGNWAETPFFLQLQSQKCGLLPLEAAEPPAFSGRENSPAERRESLPSSFPDNVGPGEDREPRHNSGGGGGFQATMAEIQKEPDMDQTVFEKSIEELNYLRDNLLLEVVDSIFYTISARSLTYRSEVSYQ